MAVFNGPIDLVVRPLRQRGNGDDWVEAEPTTCPGDGGRSETLGARGVTSCDWHAWQGCAREVHRTGVCPEKWEPDWGPPERRGSTTGPQGAHASSRP